jgi:hypothetical protein
LIIGWMITAADPLDCVADGTGAAEIEGMPPTSVLCAPAAAVLATTG